MTKSKVTDWDVTASNNSDIGGIDISEGCAPSGINNAEREGMAQWAKVIAGTDAVADTWSFGDPADLTKRVRIDAGSITTATTRVITMPDADVNLGNFLTSSTGVTVSGTQSITGTKTFAASSGATTVNFDSAGGTDVVNLYLKQGGTTRYRAYLDASANLVIYNQGAAGNAFYISPSNVVAFSASITRGGYTVRDEGNTPNMTDGEVTTGTDTTPKVPTAAQLKLAAETHGGGFGVGQTWQNVTSSRAASTTYQNTTGKMICVNIFTRSSDSNKRDVQIADDTGFSTNLQVPCQIEQVAGAFSLYTFLVDDQKYYRINGATGALDWRELR